MGQVLKDKEQVKVFLKTGLFLEEREQEIANKRLWIDNIKRPTTKIHFLPTSGRLFEIDLHCKSISHWSGFLFKTVL